MLDAYHLFRFVFFFFPVYIHQLRPFGSYNWPNVCEGGIFDEKRLKAVVIANDKGQIIF